MQKNNEEQVKQQIIAISNQVMEIFVRENCKMAMVKDVLQTLQNHVDQAVLNKRVSELFIVKPSETKQQ